MARYVIVGGNSLQGSVRIKGAKNSALALLSASILTQDKVTLRDCPDISDIGNMLSILGGLGCKCTFDDMAITIDSSTLDSAEIENNTAKKIRSSVFLLGAMLSRRKRAKIAYPGGCNIGLRPIDIHIDGLRKLGVEIVETQDALECDATHAHSGYMRLKIPSVGATENLIMASVFLQGKTVIDNCAKEPEIVDLQNMLVAMGAKVSGVEEGRAVIEGVECLHGVDYTVLPDRIVAGTYLIATAMCKGEITLDNVRWQHLEALTSKLANNSCNITYKDDKITLYCDNVLSNLPSISTGYYPDFPTDLQSQYLAMMTVGRGRGEIIENLFEDRFKVAGQLRLMGAHVNIQGNRAIVDGVSSLKGATVKACDLRGGAALVLAGLVAKGTTIVEDIYHVDRGYEDMATILSSLGADIKRI